MHNLTIRALRLR